MRPKARVMVELQQDEVIGKPARADAQGRRPAFQPVPRHQKKAAQVQAKLLRDGDAAMRAKALVAAVQRQHAEMIKRAVEDMFAHVAPGCRGGRHVHPRPGKRRAHIVKRHRHQARIAVRPAAFIARPIGAQIAFLEDVDGDAARFGEPDRLGMDGARIAVKDKVGHAQIVEKCRAMAGPVLNRAGMGDVIAAAPENLIPAVEARAPHLGPGLPEMAGQLPEEWSVRPLKHQDPARGLGLSLRYHAVCRCDPLHLTPRCVLVIINLSFSGRQGSGWMPGCVILPAARHRARQGPNGGRDTCSPAL